MDQFEKHIRDNKAVFDDHKADRAKLWANIAAQLNENPPKVVPLWKSPMVRIAASIVILLGITGIVGLTFYGNPNTPTHYVSKELQDIDIPYKGMVSYQEP
ncbi:hypothetical protein, partial [Maribacter dokdonensis]|uniref:hypothetical protein n=1 Tax=Maribacter dokdonensis TaxID=320912 RepID=UPI003297B75C